jgi:hypothetical protein
MMRIRQAKSVIANLRELPLIWPCVAVDARLSSRVRSHLAQPRPSAAATSPGKLQVSLVCLFPETSAATFAAAWIVLI